ncbi:MAG TPA: class I SAM-dependent methyltransferase [Thermoplasmata archaeon]|nr:class I SAM-dependent methyltransferase [Thermoplasmata archaeon]
MPSPAGGVVPSSDVSPRPPVLLSPAARKDLRNRMLFHRQSALDQIAALTGASNETMRQVRHELSESDLPDLLLQRGASLAYTQELPQGALLYLLVRAARPTRVVETGVGPGYSSSWILAALEANGSGELVSIGPGSPNGRASGVGLVSVGAFVPPALRSRWTLVLGNAEDRLREVFDPGRGTDLAFLDNAHDVDRSRFELHHAWSSLTPGGILLAHHTESNPAWGDFCRAQGLPPQLLDPGPPPMGALSVGPRR